MLSSEDNIVVGLSKE